MSSKMQNLVVFMEPSERTWNTSSKAGNMTLNRFCIDEDAAFELSGVYYLKQTWSFNDEEKGKEFLFLRFYFILMNLTNMNN